MLKPILIVLSSLSLVACASTQVIQPTHVNKKEKSKTPVTWIATCAATQQARFNKRSLELNAMSAGSRIYLLHNISKKTIVFNHQTDREMNAGWSSTISPNRWSALLIHQHSFSMTCTQITSSGVSYLDCSQVAKVCQVTNLNMHEKQAAYWMSENRTRAEVNVHLFNDAK